MWTVKKDCLPLNMTGLSVVLPPNPANSICHHAALVMPHYTRYDMNILLLQVAYLLLLQFTDSVNYYLADTSMETIIDYKHKYFGL